MPPPNCADSLNSDPCWKASPLAARHSATHATTSPEKLKQLRSILKRLTIARIAKPVGYRDVYRFGQHFKRLFEATPAA